MWKWRKAGLAAAAPTFLPQVTVCNLRPSSVHVLPAKWASALGEWVSGQKTPETSKEMLPQGYPISTEYRKSQLQEGTVCSGTRRLTQYSQAWGNGTEVTPGVSTGLM